MKKKTTILFVLIILIVSTLQAKVTLPAVLGDNMVLQQQTSVKIWGWSKPGATINVKTTWGIKGSAKADHEGNWSVIIKTPEASFTEYKITISDGEPITINNVLIGEVWLCSGQSNMEMTLMGIGPSGVTGASQFLAESKGYPGLRLFHVPQKSSIVPEKDCQGSWLPSSPEALKTFSATGYLYGLQLHKLLNVPVGMINASWGGTIIEAWMDADAQRAFTDVDLEQLFNEKLQVYNKPVSLYNGMISPLTNFALRGFIWYQGESNVPRYSTYADKMVALIKFWRKLWRNENMPFFYAEIAPYDYSANRMDMSEAQIDAALLREQQAKVMNMIGNTGMVCTNDLVYPYERKEIHPANKPEVARRFAYWALRNTYGYGDAIPVTGPQFKEMKIQNGKAIVSFTVSEPGGFIATPGEIQGFEIAGSDRVFFPAKAVKQFPFSREITVSSDMVTEPVAVRYCFKNWLPGNVTSVFGLPLVPFRTDNW
jgi:sialate O-acetylesterase